MLSLDFQDAETPQVPGLLVPHVSVPQAIQKFPWISGHIPFSGLTCHGRKFKGSDRDREWEHCPAALLCSPLAQKWPLRTSHHPAIVGTWGLVRTMDLGSQSL